MHILDGRKLAAKIRAQLESDIAQSGVTPGLAAVLVGDDPASHLYVSLKEKAAQEVGMYFEKVTLPEDLDRDTLIETIGMLNGRSDIHGIIVQLPLPAHLDTNDIVHAINPDKDADGFHAENMEHFFSGRVKVVSPPHAGILAFLEETGVVLANKHVVLLVNSHEFGDPLSYLLQQQGAQVHNLVQVNDYTAHTRAADVLVTAVGKANLIKAEDIKKDAIIIDVGTNKLGDKVVGDVDFESVKEKVSWITPVPGGVGPMTVAYLLKNTFDLANK